MQEPVSFMKFISFDIFGCGLLGFGWFVQSVASLMDVLVNAIRLKFQLKWFAFMWRSREIPGQSTSQIPINLRCGRCTTCRFIANTLKVIQHNKLRHFDAQAFVKLIDFIAECCCGISHIPSAGNS
jgi:hypothetical protein